jgi:3-hydroxyisobutyrate dehydrogenase-like beta-hydroxyacid dehydrogenase
MSKPARIGIIGLGIIGSRVADNLRRRGHEVYVWSRSPKPVPNFLGSAEEVAKTCDVLQFFVSDDTALLQAVQSVASVLTKKHILLFHPTVSPETTKRVGGIVSSVGAQFLDAPFTGSKVAAEKGLLVYYVGGDAAVIEKVTPLLLDSGKSVVPIGEVGQAAVMKIAANMMIAGTLQVLGEALALTTAAGISLEKAQEALALNAVRSPLLDMKFPSIIAEDFSPHFTVQHMLKDLRHAAGLSKPKNIATPATDAALASLQRADNAGRAGDDFSVMTTLATKSGEAV